MVVLPVGLGNLEWAAILSSLCETKLFMSDPLTPKLNSISGGVTTDRDNLKLWIRELTHFSPQQVDFVLAQQEQAETTAPASP
jgi:hypothetical protein